MLHRAIVACSLLALTLWSGCETQYEVTGRGDNERPPTFDPRPIERDPNYQPPIEDDYHRTPFPESRPIGREPQASAALNQVDRNFFDEAYSGNLLEIRSAEMALRESLDSQRLGMVQRMYDDHSRANQQLESIAQAKGLIVPKEMMPQHQTKLQYLSNISGDEFIQQFQKLQLEAHEEAVRLYEVAEQNVQDRDLRAYAQRTLPILKEHLNHVRQFAPPRAP